MSSTGIRLLNIFRSASPEDQGSASTPEPFIDFADIKYIEDISKKTNSTREERRHYQEILGINVGRIANLAYSKGFSLGGIAGVDHLDQFFGQDLPTPTREDVLSAGGYYPNNFTTFFVNGPSQSTDYSVTGRAGELIVRLLDNWQILENDTLYTVLLSALPRYSLSE